MEIRRLRNEVAVLLACSRTRLDTAKWASIQAVLQALGRTGNRPPAELLERLLQERAYLRGINEMAVNEKSLPEEMLL